MQCCNFYAIDLALLVPEFSMESNEQDNVASAPALQPPGEPFLQALYDYLIEAVVGVNIATQEIILWSKAAARHFGYTPEEAIQQPASCIHVDDSAFQRFQKTWRPIVEDKGYWSGEWEFKRRDGSCFPADVTVISFLQTDREHAFAVMVIRDITERKNTENIIQRRNLFVRLHQLIAECANEANSSAEALQSALEHICSHLQWPVGHCFLVNDAGPNQLLSVPLWYLADSELFKGFQEITGSLVFDREDALVGRVWTTGEPVWIPDATTDPSFRRRNEAAATGIKAAFAFPVLLQNRVLAVLEFFTKEAIETEAALLDVMGHIGKQLGIVFERERMRRELNRRAASLELLKEAASIANEASSLEEALQNTVNKVCDYTGWCIGHVYVAEQHATNNELASSSIWYLADTDQFEPLRRASQKLAYLPEGALGNRVFKSGHAAWIMDVSADPTFPGADAAVELGLKSAFAFPVLVANRVVAVLEFLSIEVSTPDKSLLDVMANVGTQLGRIFERKEAERGLIERERLAAIGTTVAKLAHEIRNPLNGMYTTVQLLQRDLPRNRNADASLRSGVRDLAKEIERLGRLLDDFKDLGRAEQLNVENFSLESLVEEVLAVERSVLDEQRIEPVLDIEPGIPMISGDRDKLKQVVLNLLHNAMEATPDGGTIVFRYRSAGGEVVLEVEDTGMGIPEDVDVFELFTTTRGGSGLGLPIVRQIITAHGGTVTLTSGANKGTIFTITLPLRPL